MSKNKESEKVVSLENELAYQKAKIHSLEVALKESNTELEIKNDKKIIADKEVLLTNKKLSSEQEEKIKRNKELATANKEIQFQKEERGKRADELLSSNKKLASQYEKKLHKENELLKVKKELSSEKVKTQEWIKELLESNKKLALKVYEKERTEEELRDSQNELAKQVEENEVLVVKINTAYDDLMKHDHNLIRYTEGLEKMMFSMSHRVRQPITQIIGVTNILETNKDYSSDDIKTFIGYLKPSAKELENFTEEFTDIMHKISKHQEIDTENSLKYAGKMD